MSATDKTKTKASTNLEFCVVCDGAVTVKVLKDYPRPTSPEVVVHDVECGVCEDCGEKYFTADQLRALEKKTNAELRKAKDYLSAEEITRLIDQISQQTGLPESKIAEAFGVSRQELHRWKTSERIQSPIAESFMRFAAKEPESFATFASSRVHSIQRGRPRKARA